MKVRLNKEICEDHLDVLRISNEQWFLAYNYEVSDYLKLVDAMAFFQTMQKALREKLIKEGKL